MLIASRDSMRVMVHAQAYVHPEAEADVLADLPEHVEAVGVGVLALVPVGGTDHQGDASNSLLNPGNGQFRVAHAVPQDHRDRRLPAHRFLERLRERGSGRRTAPSSCARS